MGPITAGLILGGVSAAASTGSNIANMVYNKAEAERNRKFQREMRDTAIISSVNQAEKLGISPSLLFGQGSNSVGGSQASSNATNPMATGVDQLTRILLQDRQIDATEKLAEEKAEWDLQKAQAYYDHQQEMAKIKNNVNSTNNYTNKNDGIMKHNYSKEYLNTLFDDLDKVEI